MTNVPKSIPVDNDTLRAFEIFESLLKCEGSEALKYQWSILETKMKENLQLVPGPQPDDGTPPPPPWPD